MSYDTKCHELAVVWIDALHIDQTRHHYPDVVHRLSQAIQTAIEEFCKDEGLDE